MRVSRRRWGRVENGEAELFDIDGGSVRAVVSNFGGIVQSLVVKDARGRDADVVLGYDAPEEYRKADNFFGAMIGPIADRIADGRFSIGDEVVQMPKNAGPDSMHCGDLGFHRVLWDWEILGDGVRLRRRFRPFECGLPGTLEACVTYRVTGEAALQIGYAARCDRPTMLSFTNHSYFALDGGTGGCGNQVLRVNSEAYAVTERETDPVCRGATAPVDGTPLDFRRGARIGERVDRTDFPEITRAGGIDHWFQVGGSGLREMAELCSPQSGIRLTCLSDAPGVLVYTSNGLADGTGKRGEPYRRRSAVCLEAERFPNGVHSPDWRDGIALDAGAWYHSVTEYRFSVEREECT